MEQKSIFENEQLKVGELPAIGDIDYTRLEAEYKSVLLLNRSIFVLFLTLVYLISIFVIPVEIPVLYIVISGIILGLILLMMLVITPYVYKVKSYAIRQRDILYRSGLIFRTTTIVPFNRVQHVELKTGPVDRMFKLSKLKIYTAGGSQSDLVIPGIAPEKASRIKEMIIAKTSSDEEE